MIIKQNKPLLNNHNYKYIAMKIACHKSSDKACRVCEYRYVCDLSAYHKHDDVPGRKPLQVDSILSATSDNPVSSRAVALAIEALRLTIGRWGNIGGNMEEQADLSARFGSIEELIGLLSERIDDFAGNEITASDVDALFSGYSYAVGIGIGNFDEL